jgi:hypothetical protein
MVKDSAAHCDAIFSPSIVVASGYFGNVGYHQFYLGVLGLQVVAFHLFGLFVVATLNVLAGARVLLCVGRPSQSFVVHYPFISCTPRIKFTM